MKRLYRWVKRSILVLFIAFFTIFPAYAVADQATMIPVEYRSAVRQSVTAASQGETVKPVDDLPHAPTLAGASDAIWWPGPDGYGYQGQAITYQWIELNTTGTLVTGLTDDNYAGPINIGFSFPFYDATYTQLMVESNGYLSLGAYGWGFPFNRCGLPHTDAPYNMIALAWGDLIANYNTGGVYYKTYTTCPVGSGNCLVVEYNNWSTYGGAEGDAGSWEAILYASGEIRLQFKDVGVYSGGASTSGIQGGFVTASWGLTYQCNTEGSLVNNTAVRFLRPASGVSLYPSNLSTYTCPATAQAYQTWIQNNTGATQTFSFTYTPSGPGTVSGPTAGGVTNLQRAFFNVTLKPPDSLGVGNVFSVNIAASGGGYNAQATIAQTITDQSFWRGIAFEPYDGRMDNIAAAYNGKIWSIAGLGIDNSVRSYDPLTNLWTVHNTPPPFGWNEVVSGCTHQNKVYMYGDTANDSFTGLWSFDMASLSWKQETPSGSAPVYPAIWAPAWVHDDETGYCYLTGGGTDGSTGKGDLKSVYVYDPAANTWRTGLPAFTTSRDFHAAFIFKRPADQHKLLCVVGGFDINGNLLNSTQCYDFSLGTWNAQNVDLGTPGAWATMAYAQKTYRNAPQLWLIAGIYDGSITNRSAYYDFTLGTWVLGPSAAGNPVFRASAATLNNEIYRLGGSTGSFSTLGVADRHIQCTSTERKLLLPVTRRNYYLFSGPNEHEPNNEWATANGPLLSNGNYYGYLNDNVDIYYFNSSATGPVVADLTNVAVGDVQFQLYSANNLIQPLVYTADPPYHLEYTITAPAGKYYLLIYSATLDATTQYTLKVSYP